MSRSAEPYYTEDACPGKVPAHHGHGSSASLATCESDIQGPEFVQIFKKASASIQGITI
jgi:hypothetical protein